VLLSSEGIVKWLENAEDTGLAHLERATVGDALSYEDQDICLYLSRDETVDAALDAFEKALAQKRPRLQAILVTQNGRPEERPLGIIIPWDLLGFASRDELP